MNHLGTKELETQRLVLRRFRLEDSHDMYHNWAKDPEVTKYLMWQPHESKTASLVYLATVLERYEQSTAYEWAIVLKETGAVVGSIAVVRQDEQVASVHIGYCIGKQWWGKGIVTEAFQRVIVFLFTEVGVNRIDSRHDPRNPGSGKVMQKCGLQYEGTLRQSDWNNQGVCDACWYALLKEDFDKR